MKGFILAVLVLVLPGKCLADDIFKPWCDAETAQGMVTLAANRIFGRITNLSEAEYEERAAWVNDAFRRSEAKFLEQTGMDFQEVSWELPQGWRQRCQLKDQII